MKDVRNLFTPTLKIAVNFLLISTVNCRTWYVRVHPPVSTLKVHSLNYGSLKNYKLRQSLVTFLLHLHFIMYRSIPAVNTSPATPGTRTSFLPSPLGFYLQICARGPGFRRGQIFPEMNENLLNIFIFRRCFQEAIQKGRKNCRFCLRKLHLSPRISLLNQLKE